MQTCTYVYIQKHTYPHTHTHIWMLKFMCVGIYVCVCNQNKGREGRRRVLSQLLILEVVCGSSSVSHTCRIAAPSTCPPGLGGRHALRFPFILKLGSHRSICSSVTCIIRDIRSSWSLNFAFSSVLLLEFRNLCIAFFFSFSSTDHCIEYVLEIIIILWKR